MSVLWDIGSGIMKISSEQTAYYLLASNTFTIYRHFFKHNIREGIVLTDGTRLGNQKLTLLYLYKILFEGTDEEHAMTSADIAERLEAYGVSTSRKTIYEDVNVLREAGVEILSGRGSNSGYRLVGRDFQLAELSLLANAVSSAKFLTEKKSAELLKKISRLTSSFEGRQLQREVYIANRPKSMNEKIYYNVDTIHKAIAEKKKISFMMFDYDLRKRMNFREGVRICSPYALCWNEEKYYAVGYYEKYGKITNFRVDRMTDIHILKEPAEKKPKDFSLSEHLNSTFSMFSGDSEDVRLRFDNDLINAVIDRFGKKVPIYPHGDDQFETVVKVKTEQPQPFFGWIFKFGTKARIIGPAHLIDEYKRMLKEAADAAEGSD